ncbi:bet1-like SNARE 1-1 [Rutidosis leptorrhynchoides]|uniref:bet1-like SNARE 1-1 n=1 Tax=Rutidosis leptorrhynchoides TaxID=125765 RepID=UPI003A98DDE4
MSYRRDNRALRNSLFDNLDGIEEGGLRASSSYPRDIDELENEKSINSLQDRVVFLIRLTGDIHEEVQSHNRMLDKMGNGMDSTRGIMSGTMDRFKMNSRRTTEDSMMVAFVGVRKWFNGDFGICLRLQITGIRVMVVMYYGGGGFGLATGIET